MKNKPSNTPFNNNQDVAAQDLQSNPSIISTSISLSEIAQHDANTQQPTNMSASSQSINIANTENMLKNDKPIAKSMSATNINSTTGKNTSSDGDNKRRNFPMVFNRKSKNS